MRNKLSDLNNILFEQLENLKDYDQSDKQLEVEINRARAMAGIATQITNNNKVALQAAKMLQHGQIGDADIPTKNKMLTGE